MKKVNISAPSKKISITLAIIVCLVVAGFWLVRTSTEVAVLEVEKEIVLLPELQWRSYDRFIREIRSLRQKVGWQLETPGRESSIPSSEKRGLSTETADETMQLEFAQRQALLADELRLRRRLIEMKIDNQVKQKQNQDDYRNKQVLEERRQQHATELNDFRRQKEKEYSSKLATLYFQLELPDLALEERSRLATEIAALKQELTESINQKSAAFKQEQEQFAIVQRKAATAELEAFRKKLEIEGEVEFRREQQELEAEFSIETGKLGSVWPFWTEGAE